MEPSSSTGSCSNEALSHIIASESRALSDGLLRVHYAFTQLAPQLNADRNCTLLIADAFLGERPRVLSGTMSGLADHTQIEAIHKYGQRDLRADSLFAALFRAAEPLRRAPASQRIRVFRRSEFWNARDMPDDCPFGRLREQLCVAQSIYAVGIVQGSFTYEPASGSDAQPAGRAVTPPEFLLVSGLHRCTPTPEFTSEDVSKVELLARLVIPSVIDHLGPTMPTPHAGVIEARLSQLTPRQRELLPFLSAGLSEQQIADRMFRSKSTIHTHVRRIYEVLGVRNRVQLVRALGGSAGELPVQPAARPD